VSSPLAIGAVSAVLRNLLDNGLIDAGAAVGGTVNVSAVAPDTIDIGDPNLTPRLNLFLYQVTYNSAWRNSGLPSRSAATGERLTNAPLALDLHYLLTAYARADFEAEILLGYAMHLLHERPVLGPAAIRAALSGGAVDTSLMPPAFPALLASDLADQVEQIKITPWAQGNDEMSKLWSAIQSKYRPSAAYMASVVLIEGTRPGVTPLPVLTPVPGTTRDEGVIVNPDVLPPLPTLFAARPDRKQAAARLGETVALEGIRLSGTGHEMRLSHRLFDAPVVVTPVAVDAAGKEATFTLPSNAAAQAALAAGQLSAVLRFTPTGEAVPRDTNAVPLALAPDPDVAGATAVRIAGLDPRLEVTLAAHPEVRPEQTSMLMLDGAEAVARPRALATDPLVFAFPATLPAATYWVRLRVDGTESILIDRSNPPPVFDLAQRLVVA
jgi:hypothetical protein